MKGIKFLALGIMAVMLAGCGSGTADSEEKVQSTDTAAQTDSGDSDEPISLNFAWCVDNVDTAQQMYIDYAEAYVEYLNSTRTDIQVALNIMDGQSSVDKQIGDIETAIAMDVDGIILSCVDPNGITPIAKEAMEAGIPVLDWRDMGDVCTVTVDLDLDESIGEIAYEWYAEYLEANPDVVLNVGMIYGAASHPNCFPRFEKLKTLEEAYPDQFHVVVWQYGDWSTDTAIKMTEDWIQTYPELNCIIGANEETAMGAVQALKGAGVMDDFMVTTFNGQSGLDLVRSGEFAMDVGCNKALGIPLLIDDSINMCLDGLTGHFNYSDITLLCVTAENVDYFEEWVNSAGDYSEGFEHTTLKDSYK